MGSTAFMLMIITIISKVTGLLREQVTAYTLGTGVLADVYSIATYIPYTIFGFIVAGIGTSFIPIYNKIKNEENVETADNYTANLVNILLIVSLILIGLIMIAAPLLVRLFAAGFTDYMHGLTTTFTRIISFNTVITLISSVYIAYLNLKGSFTIPAVTGILMNVFHIFTFYLAYRLNNFFIIAYGFVISDLLKYIMFPRALRKNGYKHRFYINWRDPNIRLLISMSAPIILSIAAVDLSTMVDQSLATLVFSGNTGAVAAIKYAILILQLISGVVVVSIATAIYPKLSALATQGKERLLKKELMENITIAQLLVIPATIGLMVLAVPTISLIFERGEFNQRSTEITSTVLFYYLPSLFGLTIRDLTVRGFYAHRDIKTPVKITVLQEIIHVILSLILSSFMGISGLALATSIASIFGGFAILFTFRKKYGRINLKRFSKTSLKILIASLLMGAVTYFSYHSLILSKGQLISFVVSVLLSMLAYTIIIIFMGIPEVRKLIRQMVRRLSSKRK